MTQKAKGTEEISRFQPLNQVKLPNDQVVKGQTAVGPNHSTLPPFGYESKSFCFCSILLMELVASSAIKTVVVP